MRPHYLFTLLAPLILLGCTSKPITVAVAPTLPPQNTPAPTPTVEIIQSTAPPPPALPGPIDSSEVRAVPQTRAPRIATRARVNLTADEVAYVSSVRQIAALMQAPPDVPGESPRVYFSKMRANIEAARSLHFQTIPPPRFVKADSLIGDGLKEANNAMTDIDLSEAMGSGGQETVDKVRGDFRNVDALLNAGYLEVDRVVNGR